MQLKTTPPKWTADWFPEELRVRKYIFDTWRTVCESYGFKEYLWPLVENTDIWKAKSGEDVGGSELTKITDRDGNISELALRPEMTPTVTRMVSRVWKEVEKPVKWFSIANFYRNERPQKWRNREFWQLNADMFGEESLFSDIEILSLSLDLMLAFNPPKGSFELYLNHRGLIDHFFSKVLWVEAGEKKTELMRLLDKYDKLPGEKFEELLSEQGCSVEQVHAITRFMKCNSITHLEDNFPSLSEDEFFESFRKIVSELEVLWYGEYIKFSASLIRGFDYYDGIIFEMFDTNPENARSLFGGGRYNGLAKIFGVKEDIPAIGFAPWDETMKLFLENWDLIDSIPDDDEVYYLPLLDEAFFARIQMIAQKLRQEGKRVNVGLSVKKLPKAIKFADKSGFSNIVILGDQELEKNIYINKNLQTGEEVEVSL